MSTTGIAVPASSPYILRAVTDILTSSHSTLVTSTSRHAEVEEKRTSIFKGSAVTLSSLLLSEKPCPVSPYSPDKVARTDPSRISKRWTSHHSPRNSEKGDGEKDAFGHRADNYEEDGEQGRNKNDSRVKLCEEEQGARLKDGSHSVETRVFVFSTPVQESHTSAAAAADQPDRVPDSLGGTAASVPTPDVTRTHDTKTRQETARTDKTSQTATPDAVKTTPSLLPPPVNPGLSDKSEAAEVLACPSSQRQPSLPHEINGSSPGHSDLSSRLRCLLAENRKLKQRQVCRRCHVKPPTITLLPCGHLVYCEDCANAISHCGVCSKEILADVRTFLS